MDLLYPDGTVLHGDCIARMNELAPESVQCVCTSPPYFGLRSYQGLPPSTWPDGWLGCLGNEPTVDLFLAHLVDVFRAVRRVLRRDGVCWVNLGDSYCTRSVARDDGKRTVIKNMEDGTALPDWSDYAKQGKARYSASFKSEGLKDKDLFLVPERFAIAMQADGWIIRSRIVWAKKSAMPESVTDRPTSAHETIWMLTREPRYFYDSEAVKVPQAIETIERAGRGNERIASPKYTQPEDTQVKAWTTSSRLLPNGANLRNTWLDLAPDADLSDLWELGPEPFSGAHFATYPTKLVKRCILAATSEKGACAACGAPWRRVTETSYEKLTGSTGQKRGDSERDPSSRMDIPTARLRRIDSTLGWQPSCRCNAPTQPCLVLDPFLGSGTTAAVARSLGRRFVGVEGSAEYVELSRKRIESTTLALAEEEAAVDAPSQLSFAT